MNFHSICSLHKQTITANENKLATKSNLNIFSILWKFHLKWMALTVWHGIEIYRQNRRITIQNALHCKTFQPITVVEQFNWQSTKGSIWYSDLTFPQCIHMHTYTCICVHEQASECARTLTHPTTWPPARMCILLHSSIKYKWNDSFESHFNYTLFLCVTKIKKYFAFAALNAHFIWL